MQNPFFAEYISDTMKLGASLPAYRTFALEELQEATHNFDDSTLLGEGSHGQIYRGKLPDGTFVAIRGLKMRKRQSPQVYTHLLEQISKLRHSHLVSALGHCLECHPDDSGVSRVFLIHAIQVAMEKGPPGRKLTWPQRIIAAIGVAKGIQFLHTGIVPGVKSNNLRIKMSYWITIFIWAPQFLLWHQKEAFKRDSCIWHYELTWWQLQINIGLNSGTAIHKLYLCT
ncbi:unnamed protein product [Prunus armeniaca]|uniref:Serine-threonine/tyrosine-protein kinase catalytic domain-containing protein n=1 Tax=Prunus armeniaca TaxID=36596 RepID=A0A6J5UXM3_PRUAR|nr:unnamed protein product [Prunus armeniaca]